MTTQDQVRMMYPKAVCQSYKIGRKSQRRWMVGDWTNPTVILGSSYISANDAWRDALRMINTRILRAFEA